MPHDDAGLQQVFKRTFARVIELEEKLAERTEQLDDMRKGVASIHGVLGRFINPPIASVSTVTMSIAAYMNIEDHSQNNSHDSEDGEMSVISDSSSEAGACIIIRRTLCYL